MLKKFLRRIPLIAVCVAIVALALSPTALAYYPAPHQLGDTYCWKFPNADGSQHFPGQMWTEFTIFAYDVDLQSPGDMQAVSVSSVLQRWSPATRAWVTDVIYPMWNGNAYDFRPPIYWFDNYGNRVTGEAGGSQVFYIYKPGTYRIAVFFAWAPTADGAPGGTDVIVSRATCTW